MPDSVARRAWIFGEPVVAVGADLAEAVEFGVEAGGDDAAFAEMRGGVGADGGGEKFCLLGAEGAHGG